MSQASMVTPAVGQPRKSSVGERLRQNLIRLNKFKFYYLLALPGIIYFLIFHYGPMFGVLIAFKDISPFDPPIAILTEPFVGLKNFNKFFNSFFFWNVVWNTVWISFLKLVWVFPMPIVLALLINEVRSTWFKRAVQTISYLPHFLSMVIVVGLVQSMLTVQGGLFNQIRVALGYETHAFIADPNYFRAILVSTTLWQGLGWGTILYLAAMANINPNLYEAASIDGANRFQQARHITLPGIAYVVAILLIFEIGNLLNAGFEQVLLLYSPTVYEVGDIIDTYVYRSGLQNLEYSFATAVGFFKAVLAMILLLGANKIAHRLGQPGIW
ncbi:MAG: ABC transporter permease subunit [Chloroflexota bacterium]